MANLMHRLGSIPRSVILIVLGSCCTKSAASEPQLSNVQDFATGAAGLVFRYADTASSPEEFVDFRPDNEARNRLILHGTVFLSRFFGPHGAIKNVKPRLLRLAESPGTRGKRIASFWEINPAVGAGRPYGFVTLFHGEDGEVLKPDIWYTTWVVTTGERPRYYRAAIPLLPVRDMGSIALAEKAQCAHVLPDMEETIVTSAWGEEAGISRYRAYYCDPVPIGNSFMWVFWLEAPPEEDAALKVDPLVSALAPPDEEGRAIPVFVLPNGRIVAYTEVELPVGAPVPLLDKFELRTFPEHLAR